MSMRRIAGTTGWQPAWLNQVTLNNGKPQPTLFRTTNNAEAHPNSHSLGKHPNHKGGPYGAPLMYLCHMIMYTGSTQIYKLKAAEVGKRWNWY